MREASRAGDLQTVGWLNRSLDGPQPCPLASNAHTVRLAPDLVGLPASPADYCMD